MQVAGHIRKGEGWVAIHGHIGGRPLFSHAYASRVINGILAHPRGAAPRVNQANVVLSLLMTTEGAEADGKGKGGGQGGGCVRTERSLHMLAQCTAHVAAQMRHAVASKQDGAHSNPQYSTDIKQADRGSSEQPPWLQQQQAGEAPQLPGSSSTLASLHLASAAHPMQHSPRHTGGSCSAMCWPMSMRIPMRDR